MPHAKILSKPLPVDPLQTEKVLTESNPLTWEISTQQKKVKPVNPNLCRHPKIWCKPPTPGSSENREGPYIALHLNLRNINLTKKDTIPSTRTYLKSRPWFLH